MFDQIQDMEDLHARYLLNEEIPTVLAGYCLEHVAKISLLVAHFAARSQKLKVADISGNNLREDVIEIVKFYSKSVTIKTLILHDYSTKPQALEIAKILIDCASLEHLYMSRLDSSQIKEIKDLFNSHNQYIDYVKDVLKLELNIFLPSELIDLVGEYYDNASYKEFHDATPF